MFFIISDTVMLTNFSRSSILCKYRYLCYFYIITNYVINNMVPVLWLQKFNHEYIQRDSRIPLTYVIFVRDLFFKFN